MLTDLLQIYITNIVGVKPVGLNGKEASVGRGSSGGRREPESGRGQIKGGKRGAKRRKRERRE